MQLFGKADREGGRASEGEEEKERYREKEREKNTYIYRKIEEDRYSEVCGVCLCRCLRWPSLALPDV